MKLQKSNTMKLKVGDVITFTNSVNYFMTITVSRVEEKSWYDEKHCRNSYGTLAKLMRYPDFKINS